MLMDSNERLAFFYCSRNSGQSKVPGEPSTRRGTAEILRSLLAQLAWTLDGSTILPDIAERFKSKVLPSTEECTEILQLIIRNLPRATIMIDGLDECEDFDKLLYRLRAIQLACGQTNATTATRLKFVFASRMNVEVLAHFDKAECTLVDVGSTSNMNDIEHYVRCEVEQPETRRILDGKFPELEQRLADILSTKAQGM